MTDLADLTRRVNEVLPAVQEDLVHLVSIPSISAQPEHAADVAKVAEELVGQLKLLNCDDVQIVQAGGQPAVIAHFNVDPALPTVCLYSHYDVQPTGNLDEWTSEPFVATERDGRLYGRGPADDKGGIAVHLAVLKAFEGKPPVNIVCLFEGEEEMGSPTLAAILEQHKDELEADVYVIMDCTNWEVGQPAFTSSLRGVTDATVEVRTLNHALHSGQFGGAVPDALTTLCRLLATLHDDEGNVVVAGLKGVEETSVDYSEERLRAESQMLAETQVIGSGHIGSRMWTKPSISVIGIDTTSIAESSNTLIPVAKARVSLRVAPSDTAENAAACLRKHLEENVPWGAQVTVTSGEMASPCTMPTSGPIFDVASEAWQQAYGVAPLTMGMGGSIGMIADFQGAFPDAFVLGTGVADPDSRMHGIDESLSLDDWRKACLAEALLLARLAETK